VDRPPSPARAITLYQELVRLGEATAARLRDGDDDGLESAMAQREALLAAISATPVPPTEAPEISAAIRRVLALDQEMLAFLEARKAQVRHELAKISESRAALESYRGAPPRGAAYVERLS
jgi:hypothetical protein